MAASHLSITRAAEQLHMSQPAVSMQVKQMEENLDVSLFERVGKKIFLTEAGQEMFRYSRRIGQLLEEADEVMQEFKGLHRGSLAISVATTAGYFATRLLAAFSQENPEISVSLDVTNRESLLLQLDNNQCDMVIMGEPPANRGLSSESFMENPLVMVASPGHPLAGEAHIPVQRFENESFVVRETGSGTRAAIERFFHDNDVAFHTRMEMTSNEAIKQSVQAGLALGIASIHTLELELQTGKLVVLDVEGLPINRQWHLVQRKGKRLSPIAKTFSQYAIDNAAKFIVEQKNS